MLKYDSTYPSSKCTMLYKTDQLNEIRTEAYHCAQKKSRSDTFRDRTQNRVCSAGKWIWRYCSMDTVLVL